jgi:hypothetical protein
MITTLFITMLAVAVISFQTFSLVYEHWTFGCDLGPFWNELFASASHKPVFGPNSIFKFQPLTSGDSVITNASLTPGDSLNEDDSLTNDAFWNQNDSPEKR